MTEDPREGESDERDEASDGETADGETADGETPDGLEQETEWSMGEQDGHRVPTDFISGFDGLV